MPTDPLLAVATEADLVAPEELGLSPPALRCRVLTGGALVPSVLGRVG